MSAFRFKTKGSNRMRMRFGVFMAPLHPTGEHLTRDTILKAISGHEGAAGSS